MKFTQQELDILFSGLCLIERFTDVRGLERDELYDIAGGTKKSFLKHVRALKQKFIDAEARK